MQLNHIEQADVLDYLRTLPDESVNCVVTSPPYFALRSYIDADHADKGKEIGSELTPEAYVETMVKVFREVRRVLRMDGCVWLNLGDSFSNDEKWGGHSTGKQEYASSSIDGARKRRYTGLPGKNLIGIPWRVALAFQADGWYLRNAAPWLKENSMPSSTTDRDTVAHEYVFHLTKSARYWFDQTAIRIPSKPSSVARSQRGVSDTNKMLDGAPGQTPHSIHQPRENVRKQDKGGRQYAGFNDRWDADPAPDRNRRTTDTFNEALDEQIAEMKVTLAHLEAVRTNGGVIVDGDSIAAFLVNLENSKLEHYAAFPQKLVRPCVLSSCPARVCSACGKPWVRVIEKTGHKGKREVARQPDNTPSKVDSTGWQPTRRATDKFEPQCECSELRCTSCGFVMRVFYHETAASNKGQRRNEHNRSESESPKDVRVLPEGFLRMEADAKVLQQDLSGFSSEDSSRQSVSDLPKNVSASQEQTILLRQEMRLHLHSETSAERDRAIQNGAGLHNDLQAGASDSDKSGLHFRASVSDGTGARKTARTKRGRASQERNQDGQQTGKSRSDRTQDARSDASTKVDSDLSVLRTSVPHNGQCPRCGRALESHSAPTKPGVVLDPFAGSGTTCLVARDLGRSYIGCDLSAKYVEMSRHRLAQSDPLQDREVKPGYIQLSLFNEGD